MTSPAFKPAIPSPKIRLRPRDSRVFDLMKDHYQQPFLTSAIASGRMIGASDKAVDDMLNPIIDSERFSKLKDVHKAAERILVAILAKENIGLVTDFDVDGITSAVVMYRALTEVMGVDESRVKLFINKRMEYSYGFNDGILGEILALPDEQIPTLLITADQGSNDSARILAYKDHMSARSMAFAGVVVTDHHNMNTPECPGADAFVNPQRPDCSFGDRTVCGCVVALMVMRVTLDLMISKSLLPGPPPRLNFLMGYAGLATVADCVSLSTPINRRIVQAAISEMMKSNLPAWRVFRESRDRIDSVSLGFLLGPCINADSRTGGDGSTSFRFLTTQNYDEALSLFNKLTVRNSERKEINEIMLQDALKEASEQYRSGRRGLFIVLRDGHHGVHGIVASRIREYYECPVFMCSPKEYGIAEFDGDTLMSCSGRSVAGLHIESIVKNDVAPKTTIEKFGGHKGAMGATIKYKFLSEFADLFDAAVKNAAIEQKISFGPEILVDHCFDGDSLAMLSAPNAADLILPQIEALEPYGIQFETPVFAVSGRVVQKRFMSEGRHAKIIIQNSLGKEISAVVFGVEHASWFNDAIIGAEWTFIVSLNRGQGVYRNQLSMRVLFAQPGVNIFD